MPFTTSQFFAVFEAYHRAVWPMPLVLPLLAVSALALVIARARAADRAMSAFLAFVWAWMALAYHLAFFAVVNPAAWLFALVFLLGALAFAWHGLIRARLRFGWPGGLRGSTGALLIAFALAGYPLLGHALGHRYPAMPTFGLPCPTTIFTLGMLLLLRSPSPRAVFVVPLLWSVIGSVAAFRLGVIQDYGLLAAGAIGVVAAICPPRTSERASAGQR